MDPHPTRKSTGTGTFPRWLAVATGAGILAGARLAWPAAAGPANMKIRPLVELVEKREPGIVPVREWIRGAKNHVQELRGTRQAGERALYALQITSRSPMGALALETGGLLIDHGWIRVLGGGSDRLPRAIHQWNGVEAGRPSKRLPGAILIADDVLGGFFAVNGGGLKGPPGHVFYYAPDSLTWEDVAPSYSEWLLWTMSGDLEKFYEGARWPGWRREVEALRGDQGISVYPFLFAAGEPIARRSRKAVPLQELWLLHVEEVPRQLGGKRASD